MDKAVKSQTDTIVGSVMLVGGGIAGMQAGHGPAGQDLSHQRLFHVNYLAQTGRGRPASEYRIAHPRRGGEYIR